MGKWLGPAAWSKTEAFAGDRLPYACHIDDCTLRLRNGSLMRSMRLDGFSFETEQDDTLNHLLAIRDVVLRSALNSRSILYHHVIRRHVQVSLGPQPSDVFSGELDRRWIEQLNSGRLFLNEQYLTIVVRPPRGKAGLPERLGKLRFGNKRNTLNSAEVLELESTTAALSSALQPYGVKLLGTYSRDGAVYSEPLELLSALYNGETRPVLLPDASRDLGQHLPYSRVSFGLDSMEVRRPGSRSFATLLGIREYPDASRAGMLDNILRVPHELVITETFAPIERQTARERIDLSLRRLRSADEAAATERAEMAAARDALGAGHLSFGDHHLSLLVRSPSPSELEVATADAAAALANIGAVAVREDVNLEPAFWGQFPGNEQFLVRRALISSANAAGFLSLHGFPIGDTSSHWGDALSVLETTASTPYFFNFHEGDLGNFTIIGPSGSGKTVILNFLTAQAQKYSPRTFLFDKDRGSEIFVRAVGGRYERITRGNKTGFNPLQLPDTPANRNFLRDWLASLLRPQGAEEEQAVARAVEEIYVHGPELRRLCHLRDLLSGGRRPQPGDLPSRLDPWILNGERAWLFDNASDELDLEDRVLAFDMTELLEDPALRTPVLLYLFHRIEERLDGFPTMILIDEAWKALDDPFFASRMRNWMKTLRKRNAVIGFATQSAADAIDSSISSAIIEQTATAIFLPNNKARKEHYCDGFGLSAEELEFVRGLPVHSRCFLVRQANRSVVARLDLGGMPDILTVLSGRESTVRRLDDLRASVGDDPSHWYPLLTGAPWPVSPAHDGENLWLDAAE